MNTILNPNDDFHIYIMFTCILKRETRHTTYSCFKEGKQWHIYKGWFHIQPDEEPFAKHKYIKNFRIQAKQFFNNLLQSDK